MRKAVGKQFGHKMRLSVNYDIAFLAGILSELSGETEKACQWDHAFYHANCFILPEEVPRSFSIAAAVKEKGDGRNKLSYSQFC